MSNDFRHEGFSFLWETARMTKRTPMRSFRIPDGLYEAASEKAAAEGRTLSDVIRELLREYVKRGDNVS